MSRQGSWIIFMCSIIIISFRKVLTLQLYCDTGSLGRSCPPLLPYSQYICCKHIYIIKDRGNPQSEHFINCFQVIKVKILINVLVFYDSFLDVPSAALQLTLTVFSKWIGFWPELPKMGYSRKNPNRRGRLRIWKFQGSVKKEVELLGVYKKKIVWFPWLSLGFGPKDFQGVPHNFTEFPWMKTCFLWNFLD